ncbi:MAG: EAL domain-containing protein [Acidimicrobiales bacterium]
MLGGLEARGLPAGCLTLEVTETAAIDLLQAVSLLRPLHDRGVRISIDDFGTGYTSLAILPDLPLDELKVDQRFVLRSQPSPADDAIVRTVRELGHRLGLTVVAEEALLRHPLLSEPAGPRRPACAVSHSVRGRHPRAASAVRGRT